MAKTQLVFDVNETLLDLSELDPIFAALFNDRSARRAWFSNLLHWSTVTTLTRRFVAFTDLAAHCLDQTAAQYGVTLGRAEHRRVFDGVANLRAHADVPLALQQLRDAGFSLHALTNSAQKTVDAQFEHTGLRPLFDHVLSVEAARCYKPHPDAYALASSTLGVPANRLRLIACHDWDTTGALRAGYRAAFVARGAGGINAAGEQPDITGEDLADVAQRIIDTDG